MFRFQNWFVLLFALLLTSRHPAAPQQPAAGMGAATEEPAGAEQDRMLEAIHRYGASYVANLPDFLCTVDNRQFEAGRKGKRWHKGDQLTSKLSYNDGQERRNLQLVNGKPIAPGRRRWRTPLVTEGEFGMLISRVLGPGSEAAFTWNRWELVRGKRLAVFDYEVDKAHSTMSLSLSDLVKARVPYHGSVFADPQTGEVWRLTQTATEIPPALLTESISTTIDYDEKMIGERRYLLPIEAVVSMDLDRKRIRNEMEFHDYQKFGSDSEIKFGAEVEDEGR